MRLFFTYRVFTPLLMSLVLIAIHIPVYSTGISGADIDQVRIESLIDSDLDGVIDTEDNCPYDFNPYQEDYDYDGIGDLCDNCRYNYNPDQADLDQDLVGDSCCCVGSTGNIDDEYNFITISDLTCLVDYLFVNYEPLYCMGEADVDGSGRIDISDITSFVSYMFVPGSPGLALCHNADINPPYVDTIPDQITEQYLTFAPVYLNNYVSDPDNNYSEISWSLPYTTELPVEITNNIAIITVPDYDWFGSEPITFRATDPDGLWDEYSCLFTVIEPSWIPLIQEDWLVSTPVELGLDPVLISNAYQIANDISHLYSFLIIKDGNLVAEKYFSGRDVNDATISASVTKSYTSALTGIALQEGYLDSLEQKMVDFYPEFNWTADDPRKSDITIRQLLQMRSGYPWEERYPVYLEMMMSTWDWINLMDDFPLVNNPGTQFGYSNLGAHIVAVILARATGTQLADLAQTHLFDYLGYYHDFWPFDAQGYNVGFGDMRIRPRDMGKFGQLFLDRGVYNGIQVIDSAWVDASFQVYSYNVYGTQITTYFQLLDYGYMWWKTQAGSHMIHYAWGHGGQLIVIVHDLNMVVVTTADHLPGQFGQEAWQLERSVLDLAGWYVSSIE